MWHLQVLGVGLFHTLAPHLLVRSLVYGMLLARFQVHRHQVYLCMLPSSLTFPPMFLNGIVNWIIVQTVEIPTQSLPFFWYLLLVSLLVRQASLCKHGLFSSI